MGVLIRCAIGALQQFRSGGSIGDLLGLSVPRQTLAGFVGDHREFDGTRRKMRVGNCPARSFTLAHAIEEFPEMGGAHVACDLVDLARGAFGAGQVNPFGIRDENRAFFAVEKDAVIELRRELRGTPEAVAPRDGTPRKFEMGRERVGRGDFT